MSKMRFAGKIRKWRATRGKLKRLNKASALKCFNNTLTFRLNFAKKNGAGFGHDVRIKLMNTAALLNLITFYENKIDRYLEFLIRRCLGSLFTNL